MNFIKKLHRLKIILIAISFIIFSTRDSVGSDKLKIVRDAEVEDFLNKVILKLIDVSNFKSRDIKVFLIQDKSFNAFVVPGYAFVHSGIFMFSDNSDIVFGVLAHEMGHLANRHFYRASLRQVETLKETILIGLATGLIGMGIPVAGLAGVGGVIGLMNATNFSFFKSRSFSRADESEADSVGSELLKKIGRSPVGLVDGMRYLGKSLGAFSSYLNEYFLSHPMPDKREFDINSLTESGLDSGQQTKDKSMLEIEDSYMRVKSKIKGYMEDHSNIAITYKTNQINKLLKKNIPFYEKYRRIQGFIKRENWTEAIELANSLLQDRPQDPYVYEILGDCHYMLGDENASIKSYQKAFLFLSDNNLIAHKLASIQVRVGGKFLIDGLNILKDLSRSDRQNPGIWHDLAIGYKNRNNIAYFGHSKAMELFFLKKCNSAKKIIAKYEPFVDKKKDIMICEDFGMIKSKCKNQIL